ncbi:MAG: VOC family protein [Rhodospirillaceae bacterium]|nr:VOC family protein [Rhodospirillaceae bacterium]
MQKITPFLWFDNKAEEAANFYAATFPNSKITHVMRYGEGAPLPAGTVLTITVSINGLDFVCLNGGPHYTFSPATSFMAPCDTQAEVDHLWDALSAGGEVMQCGWLTDKFGVTWQITPHALLTMMSDKDSAKVKRVTAAMMQMKKLDLPALTKAFEGRA